MNEAQFYNLSSINRHLDWFQAFAVADHMAVNILVSMPLNTLLKYHKSLEMALLSPREYTFIIQKDVDKLLNILFFLIADFNTLFNLVKAGIMPWIGASETSVFNFLNYDSPWGSC